VWSSQAAHFFPRWGGPALSNRCCVWWGAQYGVVLLHICGDVNRCTLFTFRNFITDSLYLQTLFIIFHAIVRKPPQKCYTSPSVQQSFRIPLFSYSNISIFKKAGIWLNAKDKTIVQKLISFFFCPLVKISEFWIKLVLDLIDEANELMIQHLHITWSAERFGNSFGTCNVAETVSQVCSLRIEHVTQQLYRFFDISNIQVIKTSSFVQQMRQPWPTSYQIILV